MDLYYGRGGGGAGSIPAGEFSSSEWENGPYKIMWNLAKYSFETEFQSRYSAMNQRLSCLQHVTPPLGELLFSIVF